MNKKSLKVAKIFINIVFVILFLCALICFGFAIANIFGFNEDFSKYIYVFLGGLILPCEFLKSGNVGTFISPENNILAIIVSSLLAIFAMVVLIFNSNLYNSKVSSKKRTASSIVLFVMCFVVFGYLIFSVSIFTANSYQMGNLLNNNSPELFKLLTVNLGLNLLLIKEFIVLYIGTVMLGLSLIFIALTLFKKSSKVKIYSSINFYTEEYAEPEKEEKKEETKVEEEQPEVQTVASKSIGAKNLIEKIMQLDELKEQGKISDVEYVKLRQSAIKRYSKR